MKNYRLAFWFALFGILLLSARCAPNPSTPTLAPPSPTEARPTLSALPLKTLASPPSSLPTASPVPGSNPTSPAQAGKTPPGPTATNVTVPNSSDWTTYHRDNVRTGYVPDTPDPRQLTIAWKAQLDGAVYAEPLIVGGHVIAATENNSIYSLDVLTGQVAWQTRIGDPVSRAALPCGNISPLGITGTPVYDPASNLVFAVAEIGGPAHVLVGLDASTGQVRLRRSADPGGMEPRAQQQRAALALWQGMVYIAYGGLFGDCGNYHGWVVASRTDGGGPLFAFRVPTNREGGIWAPPGPAVDTAGRLFVSVGNGDAVVGDWDHSDSVLRLSSSLKLEDAFAPVQWGQDNLVDADLGSLGPVLLPNKSVLIIGKAGIGYLLNSEALGGVGGETLSKEVCHAYGGAALVASTVFVPCNEGVQEIMVGPGASMTLGWRADGVPGSPVVGGNTLYTLDRNGTLHALDVAKGEVRASAEVGETSRFATPTLFQNKVIVGTMSGIVALTIS